MKKHIKKLQAKITGFLLEGITPEKLAMAMALGATLGIIPILGITTVICAGLAYYFKLNMPAIQLVNYFMYPLQIILYIPFLKTGASLLSDEPFNYSFSEITDMFAANWQNALSKLFFVNLYGLLLWLILAPFLYLLIFVVLRFVFSRIKNSESGFTRLEDKKD
jgi:uncharacterized protein (DUF2062 family)